MAITNDGSAVQVGLIPDPFTHQLAYASQMSGFDFADASVDPRAFLGDPNSNDADGDYGLNLILVNSVTRPLKLVDMYQYVRTGNGPAPEAVDQVCYPTGCPDGASRDHEIPAARPYPVRGAHLTAAGQPAMLAGVGFYRFDPTSYSAYPARSLSFSLGDSASPLVGVHVRLTYVSRGIFRYHASYASVAVTADLEAEYANLVNFGSKTLLNPDQNPFTKPVYSVGAAAQGSITVWGAPIAHDVDRLGTNSVVVWVRDVTSTAGL